MTSSESRLAETIELFYSAADLSSDGAMAGHAYKRAVDELDSGVGRDLDAPFRHTVLEPVGRFCSYFQTVNGAIDKRNKKVPPPLPPSSSHSLPPQPPPPLARGGGLQPDPSLALSWLGQLADRACGPPPPPLPAGPHPAARL